MLPGFLPTKEKLFRCTSKVGGFRDDSAAPKPSPKRTSTKIRPQSPAQKTTKDLPSRKRHANTKQQRTKNQQKPTKTKEKPTNHQKPNKYPSKTAKRPPTTNKKGGLRQETRSATPLSPCWLKRRCVVS